MKIKSLTTEQLLCMTEHLQVVIRLFNTKEYTIVVLDDNKCLVVNEQTHKWKTLITKPIIINILKRIKNIKVFLIVWKILFNVEEYNFNRKIAKHLKKYETL